MSVRNRTYELTQVEEFDEFLAKFPVCAVFKAGSCHKTMQGYGHVEDALSGRPDVHVAFVRVIESRPVSNYIAETTGIKHESPQFILFVEGKPVYDVDNWDITPEALEANLEACLGSVGENAQTSSHKGDVQPYVDLLQQLLDDQLPEEEFSQKWIMTFKMDASPRSTEEFRLLNSLYGDPDSAHIVKLADSQEFKDKARQLLEALTSR